MESFSDSLLQPFHLQCYQICLKMPKMIKLKRIYEPPAESDGERLLVDRLWPRGISKDAAKLTQWLKDLAPSPGLRRWFRHNPERWSEFQDRYRTELMDPQKSAILQNVVERARRGPVTLLYAARDPEHNNAVVLKNLLAELLLNEDNQGASL